MFEKGQLVDLTRGDLSNNADEGLVWSGASAGRSDAMTNERWIICWREARTDRIGALKCPGSGTREEACAQVRALSVLFPERSFWVELDSRAAQTNTVVIRN